MMRSYPRRRSPIYDGRARIDRQRLSKFPGEWGLRLYSAALSLFSKKVEIVLAEKGLRFERILVPFSQQAGYAPKHPDVLAANPKGQVPVLCDGALTIYDSTVIIEYLEDAYPDPPLFPRAPGARARCRQFDVFADEVMLVPLRMLMHRTGPRPADQSRWLEWEEKAKTAEHTLAEQFAKLENWLGKGRYFCGDFSVADIAVFMAVFYAQRLGGPALGDTPRLLTWYRTLKTRQSFALVTAEIVKADVQLSAPVEGSFRE
jgi:glutathione S-transferase